MRVRTTAIILGLTLTAAPALAVSPFFEDFPGEKNTGGWSGRAIYTNPGTGGVGGDGDGYLEISRLTPGQFAARTFVPAYSGDYIAGGITGISLWLNQISGETDQEIYLAIGNENNVWQYNIGFTPPRGQWAQFFVDLTDPSLFNPGGLDMDGTFEDALREATLLRVRHDTFPATPAGIGPPSITGALGMDRVRLIPSPGAVTLAGVTLLVSASRRRR